MRIRDLHCAKRSNPAWIFLSSGAGNWPLAPAAARRKLRPFWRGYLFNKDGPTPLQEPSTAKCN